jgi:hypothetical protein
VKRIFVVLFCFFVGLSGVLADNVSISVITCSPGDEVYSLFGHTGLRYRNSDDGTDIVFSYGYFNFNAPNFVWRFILGETDYMVGAVPYNHFIREYEERGSAVVEQVLDLTSGQEAALYSALVDNCREENRIYRYNYFYNNCTTRVRDQVYSVAGDVAYVGAGVPEITFREALAGMTSSHPWYAFGIDLLLGADVDEPASRSALQFIPGFFMNDLDMAHVSGTPLVKEKKILLHEQPRVHEGSNATPFNVSLLFLLFTMIVILCEIRHKRTYWGFDLVIMMLQGLAGLLLLFMALFSSHPAVGGNWLMLLLNPLALFIMPIMVYRLMKRRTVPVAWLQVAFVLLFFISAIFSLQVYPVPLYFCAVALLARSLFHLFKNRICELELL